LFPNRGDLDFLTEGHRVRAPLYGMGYAIAFYSTLMFVVHGTKPASSDSAARDYTARQPATGCNGRSGGATIPFGRSKVFIPN